MAAGSRKRRRGNPPADGGAASSRSSAHLLVHTPSAAQCADAAPTIEPAPPSMLGTMVWPLDKDEFLATEWRQRAVATIAPPGTGALEARTAAAAEALCGLDLESMLSETASERLFVWMRSESKEDERVASFEVDEPRAAIICHDAGGSLYFRSPQAMVEPWVGRLSAELGLNFGAVYSQPAAGPGALPQKGEIEVFATRAGHVTDWHTDFMENFTLQLKGKKRWRIARSGLDSPIRGYTPHYKSVDNLTQQLKLHRMQKPRFPAPAPWEEGSDSDVVELGPGDFLYHPAGVWHRVECTEDSLSMNISLIGLSWADHVADATRHAMWRHSSMRAQVTVRPSNYGQARADAEQRLAAARTQLAGLTGEDVMPPCLLLPRHEGEWIVGSTGDGRQLSLPEGNEMQEQRSDDEDEEEEDEDVEHDEEQDEDVEEQQEQDEDDDDADEKDEQNQLEEEEHFLTRGEDEAGVALAAGSSRMRIRINPLAVLLRSGEEERADDSDGAGGLLYVCHVMFGNEEVGSAVETHIRCVASATCVISLMRAAPIAVCVDQNVVNTSAEWMSASGRSWTVSALQTRPIIAQEQQEMSCCS